MRNEGFHVGIIPDGSRRWGRRNSKPPLWDGKESGEKAREIIEHIFKNHPEITEITIWAMSTENFQRNQEDKERVHALIEYLIKKMIGESIIQERKIRVNFFGTKIEEVSVSLKDAIKRSMELTKAHSKLKLNIGLGYGGKSEIVMAAINLAKKIQEKSPLKNLSERVSQKVFEEFLMVPRPLDLIIRTGGEKRLSGFMLYQAEYAELFFLDSLWPDFTTKEFDKVMSEFRKRERRFGK
ncbi:MAG: polyprenyl diphosphate synthase [Candidatus Aenigmarchaeota archaeon]|nr:polyprenyl diphosphate synthase [Candidatus Aenigmarchaeota archaeon]